MKCADAGKRINSCFDNNTDPLKDPVLAEHIKSCPVCRAEFEFLLKYKKVLSEIKPVNAPENFLKELHRKIELQKQGGVFKKFFHSIKDFLYSFRFPLEAAGVAAVAFMIFFLYRPFFSERAPVKTTDYAAQAPREEMSGKTLKPEAAGDLLKSSRAKTIPVKKKTEPVADTIAADKDSFKQDYSADKSFSELEKNYELPAIADKKKSRFMMKEESKKTAEEKITAAEVKDSGIIAGMKKEAVKPGFMEAEKIFRELDVSVILKKTVQDGKLHYKVRVTRKKYDSLIRKLKEKYSVQERIIKTGEKFYVSEIFLTNK